MKRTIFYFIPLFIFNGLFNLILPNNDFSIILELSSQQILVIEDFEDVSDFSGLIRDEQIKIEGNSSGRWEDTIKTKSIKKVFNPPLNLSGYDYLTFWIYSHKNNSARIQLVLDSDNPSDPSGWDYYTKEIIIDFEGFKYFKIPLSEFNIARNPTGWDKINYISFHSDGWGHTPQSDTMLNFDIMLATKGIIKIQGKRQYWSNKDFIYEYTLRITNNSSGTEKYTLSLFDSNLMFDYQFSENDFQIPPNGFKDIQLYVIIPKNLILLPNYLKIESTSILLKQTDKIIDAINLKTAIPLPYKEHPYILLDNNDAIRINEWASKYSWAKTHLESIISYSDSWEDNYKTKYGLSGFTLPPEGGQWGMWYVCPYDNSYLSYSPPMTHRCPKCQRTFSGWPYDQVIYGRMHNDLSKAALRLAQSYLLTKDIKYANQTKMILLEYTNKYLSYPIHDKDNKPSNSGGRVLSQTLDESGWFFEIAWAYELIKNSGVLNENELFEIENKLLYPGYQIISRNKAGKSNWQSWHNLAMTTIGLSLDDFPIVNESMKDPANGFIYQLSNSITTDGFWYEGSWGYHFYALNPLVFTAEMMKRSGIDDTTNLFLQKMFTFPILFSEPDGTLPPFNDSGKANVNNYKSLYEIAYKWSGDSLLLSPLSENSRPLEALFWGVEKINKSDSNIISETMVFDNSGYVIFRSNYETNPLYIAADYGPHGGWHGHYDKLNFILYFRDKELVVDAGTHSYALPIHDGYDKTTLAHNTIVVDMKNQKESQGTRNYVYTFKNINLGKIETDSAYYEAKLSRIILTNSDYVLDDFEINSKDNQLHQYDYIVHLDGKFEDINLTKPYSFESSDNGYSYLKNPEELDNNTSQNIILNFSDADGGKAGSYWTSENGISATFNIDCSFSYNGECGAKLHYDFSQTKKGYILYTISIPSLNLGKLLSVKMAIKGDNSGNLLRIRINDATDERFVYTIGNINYLDWKSFEANDIEKWNHYLGNNDGKFDYPAKSFAIELNYQNGATEVSDIYLDDVILVFENGEYILSDFEIKRRYALIYSSDSEKDVKTIIGKSPVGWGEDVSFVMKRIKSLSPKFKTLFCLYNKKPDTGNCRVETPEQSQCNNVSCKGYVIKENENVDLYLFKENKDPNQEYISFNSSEYAFGSDGDFSFIRRSENQLSEIWIVNGKLINLNQTMLIESDCALNKFNCYYKDEGKTLIINGSTGCEYTKIYAPIVETVLLNGLKANFEREGDYIILKRPDSVVKEDGYGYDDLYIEDTSNLNDIFTTEDDISYTEDVISYNDIKSDIESIDAELKGDITKTDLSEDISSPSNSSGCSCSYIQ